MQEQIARGSATESAALIDVLLARKLVTANVHYQARECLLQIVRMLTPVYVWNGGEHRRGIRFRKETAVTNLKEA